jgi:hypothetical protein
MALRAEMDHAECADMPNLRIVDLFFPEGRHMVTCGGLRYFFKLMSNVSNFKSVIMLKIHS